MTIKQDINWRTEEPPYKDLKDGQLLLICTPDNYVTVFEYDKEESYFYDAYESGDTFTLEEFNKILKAWAYVKYPEKEEKKCV